MEMSLWIVTGLSLFCWLVPWVMFVRFRRVPAGCGEGREDVRISLVVPARNEEDNIGGLLDSLREHDLHEVIVVDDQSEDKTAAVAARQGARVVQGESPPPGWLGKPWACYQGARIATGDWLLFLDADTSATTYDAFHAPFLHIGDEDLEVADAFHPVRDYLAFCPKYVVRLLAQIEEAGGGNAVAALYDRLALVTSTGLPDAGVVGLREMAEEASDESGVELLDPDSPLHALISLGEAIPVVR